VSTGRGCAWKPRHFVIRALKCKSHITGAVILSDITRLTFPHELHLLFFVTPLRSSITAKVIHYAAFKDLCNNQNILQKKIHERKMFTRHAKRL